MQLKYKQTAKISYTFTPQEKFSKVEFISSNTKVAVVDENGSVKAAGKGNADITVKVTDKDGNVYQDTCRVTVKYTLVQILIRVLLLGFLWY